MNTRPQLAKRIEITIETRSITVIRTSRGVTGAAASASSNSETGLQASVQPDGAIPLEASEGDSVTGMMEEGK